MSTTTENTTIADTLDGVQGVLGLKTDVTLDNWSKRIGAMVPPLIVGALAQGAVTRQGLKTIDAKTANAVVAATPGGSLFIRKI